MSKLIGNLEKLLAQGEDSALLRFSLGSAYLKAGQPAAAVDHLERAVQLDEGYSAAWKLLGRAQTEAGLSLAAMASYRRGIQIAAARGDKQAAREMQVFLRRLERATGPAG